MSKRPNFYEIKFEEPIQSWITEIEEINTHTYDIKEMVAIAEILRKVWEDGFNVGANIRD